MSRLKFLADDTGPTDVWTLVTTGWVEMSPSGGFHFHYRLTGADVLGNTKLARRPSTPDELASAPGQRLQVLAETRGDGGQVVVAPSRHHAAGRPWIRLVGGPATAPVLTVAQRDAFHALLRTLDEQPETTAPPGAAPPAARHNPAAGITPGDDYENRTDWADILIPYGWTLATQRGRTRYWTRLGKTFGISATTGRADDRDRLFVATGTRATSPMRTRRRTFLAAFARRRRPHERATAAAARRELARRSAGPARRP